MNGLQTARGAQVQAFHEAGFETGRRLSEDLDRGSLDPWPGVPMVGKPQARSLHERSLSLYYDPKKELHLLRAVSSVFVPSEQTFPSLVDQDDTFGSNTAPYYPVSPLSPQHLHQIEHLGKTTAVDHKDLLNLQSHNAIPIRLLHREPRLFDHNAQDKKAKSQRLDSRGPPESIAPPPNSLPFSHPTNQSKSIKHHQVLDMLALSSNSPTPGLFSMAEEAMAFIAAKIFNFDDHGIHVPYQKPTPGAIEDLMRPDDKEEEEQISHQRSTPLALEILSQPHDGYDPYVTHLRGSKTYLESDPPRQALITHPDITVPPAPVSGGRSVPAGQVTVGLTLLVNGKTFPKIEGGQERWYTQRPGHGNNYSRYSDLVRHDKAKGLTPLPKASKAELATARHQQTFG
ncbi:hypothetical protein M436DRAFT_78218 [Aureobasidium namibiae CBS 147.97]|uniref:Uncharacterized protein n=1 Tax=Aureobasidium namibiae CBS 147.97 TaxID=1043004 RepID=A0A074X377_9PEZI|nr:uncharacterized protein M436DRAFT_78218 [Aureobasidium namibiae CBS 147.97]KEQ76467.1 hypothetical protein M436DRAFT_78218 [Aureobasidium namibiae CBS 147.97]